MGSMMPPSSVWNQWSWRLFLCVQLVLHLSVSNDDIIIIIIIIIIIQYYIGFAFIKYYI
jgi:hypothetical protein